MQPWALLFRGLVQSWEWNPLLLDLEGCNVDLGIWTLPLISFKSHAAQRMPAYVSFYEEAGLDMPGSLA
jgi:hypothetical protein